MDVSPIGSLLFQLYIQAFSTEPYWIYPPPSNSHLFQDCYILVGKSQPKPFVGHDCILASIHIYIYIIYIVTLATTVDATPFRIPQNLFRSHPHLYLSAHRLVVDLALGWTACWTSRGLWDSDPLDSHNDNGKSTYPFLTYPPRNKTSLRVNRWFPLIRPY